LDLVVEQLRVAAGERLGFGDPVVRGHAFEFRINGEDAGRGFLPSPGVISGWRVPGGPGVRVDAGVEAGSVVGQAFDSLLAKLVVTGRDRAHALARARRALAEFEVGGVATVLPFHRLVVDDPAFAPADAGEAFRVHTRWIETEFAGVVEPFAGPVGEVVEPAGRERVVVEVAGRRLEVVLPAGLGAGTGAGTAAGAVGVRRAPGRRAGGGRGVVAGGGDGLSAPMQGTVVRVAVVEGQVVAAGDVVVVLEAMKMEQPLLAHKAGTVVSLAAQVGASVGAGTILCEIKD
jgi:acetyl-CoA/propionyl-CoA carboxylase biotin carboxyl carrier protein